MPFEGMLTDICQNLNINHQDPKGTKKNP